MVCKLCFDEVIAQNFRLLTQSPNVRKSRHYVLCDNIKLPVLPKFIHITLLWTPDDRDLFTKLHVIRFNLLLLTYLYESFLLQASSWTGQSARGSENLAENLLKFWIECAYVTFVIKTVDIGFRLHWNIFWSQTYRIFSDGTVPLPIFFAQRCSNLLFTFLYSL